MPSGPQQPKGEFEFARALGQKPVSSQAAHAVLRGMLKQAGIEKKIRSRRSGMMREAWRAVAVAVAPQRRG